MCIHWILLLFRKSSKSKRTPTSVTRYNQFEISDDEDDDITTEQKPPNSLVAGVNNREQSPTVSVKLELTGDIDIISEETIFNKPDQTLLIDSSAYFHLPIDSSVSKSQPIPPSPMECFPQQTATCDDVPNTTDIRVSHDDHIESNSLTKESQEQRATPAHYKAPVTTDDKNTITEETVFNKLDQTLLIDSSAYFYLPIDSSVSNLKLEPGVSFLAYCNNMDYHDTTIPVIVPKGYYLDSRGQFTLNEEVWELACPKCKQPIQGNNPQGIGFSKCTVDVKYRDVNGERGSFNFQVDMSTFAFTQLNRPGHIKYSFVKFTVYIS